MNEIKILILCNNPIALPAIRELLFNKNIAALATLKRNKEMQHILSGIHAEFKTPVFLLEKKGYEQQLQEIIEKNNIDVVLMMTFPFLINKKLLRLPAKGFINFHYGLLPQCRGPHPILWHLLRNDKEAGVTVHRVDENIDTGDVILQERILIEETDTYGLLQSKLAFLGAKLAIQLMKILSYGTIIPAVKQDESAANFYEMPGANRLTINWKTMSAQEIIRLVNACNPWNKAAGTSCNRWVFGITEAEIIGEADETAEAGNVLCCNKQDGLVIQSSDNKKIKITIAYTHEGFLSGYRLSEFGIVKGVLLG